MKRVCETMNSIGNFGEERQWIFDRMHNIQAFAHYDCFYSRVLSLRWRHNERDSVSNHQPHDCLLNRLFRRRSKKTSKLRVTGLCVGNSPGSGEFPVQMASYAENDSIWWRHHDFYFSSFNIKFFDFCCAMCYHVKRGENYRYLTSFLAKYISPNITKISNSRTVLNCRI